MKWAQSTNHDGLVRVKPQDTASVQVWFAFHSWVGREVIKVSIFPVCVFVLVSIGHTANVGIPTQGFVGVIASTVTRVGKK